MPDVRHDPRHHRFEVHDDDGRRAGFTVYVEHPGVREFVHTEIDPAFEGQGLGSILAAGALDATRAEGRTVIATCPFIRGYIERHAEYQDLLATT
jgi:predicted GNAT family acetyltransferase